MIEIKEIITDNKDLEYIKECAESVGMDVTDKTAFSISFIAEVMRKMKEQSIVIPKGSTNGDVVKFVFSDVAIEIHFRMLDDWWNSPYRKE